MHPSKSPQPPAWVRYSACFVVLVVLVAVAAALLVGREAKYVAGTVALLMPLAYTALTVLVTGRNKSEALRRRKRKRKGDGHDQGHDTSTCRRNDCRRSSQANPTAAPYSPVTTRE